MDMCVAALRNDPEEQAHHRTCAATVSQTSLFAAPLWLLTASWGAMPLSPGTRAAICQMLRKNGSCLEGLSLELRADHAMVLAAVGHDGAALKHAADELKCDRTIVMAAVRNNGLALPFASTWLLSDWDVLQTAIRQNPQAMMYLDYDVLLDVRALVMDAVSRDGLALRWAPARFQSDRDVVLTAVRQNGLALAHASADLRDDRALVHEAVKQGNAEALAHASEELRTDLSMRYIAGADVSFMATHDARLQ